MGCWNGPHGTWEEEQGAVSFWVQILSNACELSRSHDPEGLYSGEKQANQTTAHPEISVMSS